MAAQPEYNVVTDLLDRQADGGFASKAAYIDPARSLTYGALQADTCRCANLLTRLGMLRENRLAMLMLDTVDFPVVFLGAIRAGIVPVPVNTLLPPEHVLYILNDMRATGLVISAALLAAMADVLAQVPSLQHVLVAGARAQASPLQDLAGALTAEPASFATVATHPDETAFMLYSSGPTGMPEGVRHRHTSLMATATAFGRDVLGIRSTDICLSAAKLFFAYGLGNSLSFPLSVGATTILVPERGTPAAMFGAMARHQPTLFFGVPTLFGAMLAEADCPAAATARLRLCVSAGEALPAPIGTAWQARFGVETIDRVGSTELLHIFLSNRPGSLRYGSSGVAVPGYRLRLVNEAGAEGAEGEIGELLVSGPSAGDNYWNQRAKSLATFEGPWTRTGDKYTRDAQHRYSICGRADDMFKVSGSWVSPLEVEAALLSHPAVLEAAVMPHDPGDGLLKPKAYVVPKAGISTTDLVPALQDHVKAAVGPWKYPRWITFMDTLPKTATGKTQRFRLRRADASQ